MDSTAALGLDRGDHREIRTQRAFSHQAILLGKQGFQPLSILGHLGMAVEGHDAVRGAGGALV